MNSRWLYITVNIKRVLNNLAHVLHLYGIISITPVIISLIYTEYLYTLIFSVIGLLTYLSGLLLYKDRFTMVNKTESLVIAALSYVLFAVLGAIPFLTVSSFLNGFFELMSGYTTTGLTMFNPEKLPKTLVFFRSYSQWIGGAGIVVFSLTAVKIPVRSASKLAVAESVKKEFFASMKSIMSLIVKAYFILTLIGIGVFLLAGMNIFDSVIHAFSAISTGGFSSYANSTGYFQSASLKIATIVIMILGAVNFTLYYHLGNKDKFKLIFKDRQLRYMFILIVLFFVMGLVSIKDKNIMDIFFHSVSSLTTSGFNIDPASNWPGMQKWLMTIEMIIGGGDGSTAGGIKIFRFLILFSLVGWFVRQALLPNRSNTAIRINERIIKNEEIKGIIAFVVLYFIILLVSTLVLSLYGYNMFNSFFESASSLGTVGLSTGITKASMAAELKLILIFNMWAGRLEILSVLILFNPFIWKLKRKSS